MCQKTLMTQKVIFLLYTYLQAHIFEESIFLFLASYASFINIRQKKKSHSSGSVTRQTSTSSFPMLWHIVLQHTLSYQPQDRTKDPRGILGYNSSSLGPAYKLPLGMTAHLLRTCQTDVIKTPQVISIATGKIWREKTIKSLNHKL